MKLTLEQAACRFPTLAEWIAFAKQGGYRLRFRYTGGPG